MKNIVLVFLICVGLILSIPFDSDAARFGFRGGGFSSAAKSLSVTPSVPKFNSSSGQSFSRNNSQKAVIAPATGTTITSNKSLNSKSGSFGSASKNNIISPAQSKLQRQEYAKTTSDNFKNSSDYSWRRDHYMNSPSYAPIVVQQPSFGAWDTIFLLTMLNSSNTLFFHNNKDDESMKKFNEELEKLSKENEEIKKQYDSLKKELDKLAEDGVSSNPNEITELEKLINETTKNK